MKGQGRFKDATGPHLPAPTFAVNEVATQGGTTVVRGTLRSGRGGFQIGIGVAPNSGVQSIRLDSQQAVSVDQLKGKEPTFVRVWGIGTRDVPMEISFDTATAPKVTLYERSPLPDSDEGRALIAARPADAAPDYNGDAALVFVVLDLKP